MWAWKNVAGSMSFSWPIKVNFSVNLGFFFPKHIQTKQK